MKQLTTDLIITALEGGSNYWSLLDRVNLEDEQDSRLALSEKVCHAIDKGLEIKVFDAEDETELLGVLTKQSVKEAWKLMKQDHESHWMNAKSEQWDAETADVFFQLAVMGELVFG